MKTAILIPVYNEEKYIREVLRQSITQNVDAVIVALDCPTDRSAEVIKQFKAQIPNGEKITILEQKKNVGLTQTMKLGFTYALENGFELVIKGDGDGQMDMTKSYRFIEEYKKMHTDLIIATYNKGTPLMIRKDMWIYSLLFFIATGVWLKDILSEFRSFSRKAMGVFIQVNVADGGSNISIIDIWRNGCSISKIEGGVNYRIAKIRPAHMSILIDIRKQFIKSLWLCYGIRAKVGSIVAIPVLFLLLIFNLTAGLKYNSPFSKNKTR